MTWEVEQQTFAKRHFVKSSVRGAQLRLHDESHEYDGYVGMLSGFGKLYDLSFFWTVVLKQRWMGMGVARRLVS